MQSTIKDGGVEQNTLEMKLCVCVCRWRTDANLKGVFIRRGGKKKKKKDVELFSTVSEVSNPTSQL